MSGDVAWEFSAMRADTERHLRIGTGCQSCAENVLGLLDRLEAAEAKVARVEALADEWERNDLGTDRLCAADLRAALTGEDR